MFRACKQLSGQLDTNSSSMLQKRGFGAAAVCFAARPNTKCSSDKNVHLTCPRFWSAASSLAGCSPFPMQPCQASLARLSPAHRKGKNSFPELLAVAHQANELLLCQQEDVQCKRMCTFEGAAGWANVNEEALLSPLVTSLAFLTVALASNGFMFADSADQKHSR